MRADLTIDLSALQHNWRCFRDLSSGVTAAVVKADAYGLGAGKVAGALASAGACDFFIAQTQEAEAVRQAIGSGGKIYLLGGLFAGDIDLIKRDNIIPILNTPEQIKLHKSILNNHPFAVHLDTGMNRLGVSPVDWASVKPHINNADLIMSHLSNAEDKTDSMNTHQRKLFMDLTDGMTPPRSLSASYGTAFGADFHFDMTRPGIGLYGSAVLPNIKPVVGLSLPVLQVRKIAKGAPVGYDGTWVAPVPSTIATLNAGYADGIFYALARGELHLFADEIACPLIGRVSMDLMSVDISHLAETPTHLSLLNHHQGIDSVAKTAQTIPYEVLCALSQRYARNYING